MIFTEAPLAGAWLLDVEPIADERGFFSRWYCAEELEKHGLQPLAAQGNLSFNYHAGTLRGLHMQLPPVAEAKLVRCTRGAVHDMIVDTRAGSPTRWEWFGVDLTADNRRAVYVPSGFAHGYQSLTADAEVMYQVSEFYAPGHEVGLRYDDPDLGLEWPIAVESVSDKDTAWPFLADIDKEAFGRERNDHHRPGS